MSYPFRHFVHLAMYNFSGSRPLTTLTNQPQLSSPRLTFNYSPEYRQTVCEERKKNETTKVSEENPVGLSSCLFPRQHFRRGGLVTNWSVVGRDPWGPHHSAGCCWPHYYIVPGTAEQKPKSLSSHRKLRQVSKLALWLRIERINLVFFYRIGLELFPIL